jgi:phosphate transport system substrate-binding protein
LSKLANKWFILPVAILILVSILLAGCSSASSSTPATTTAASPTTTTPATTPTKTATPTTTTPTQSISPTTTTPVVSSPTPSVTPTLTSTLTPTPNVAVAQATALNGAGATFPQPLYTKWFDIYNTQTNVKINYQGVGSGSGITQITAGTLDFGASDGIMTDAQVKAAEAAFGPILHVPMTSGAEAIIYNLEGIKSGQIKLTGDVLANIYLKKITNWNDPAIAALNPGLTLPNHAIAVVHRSDSSGTTYIFTNYLSKVSSTWSTQVGNATAVSWPGDVGGAGNAGVAAQVQIIPGAIGYVELAYAIQNNLPWCLLQNKSGKFLEPSLAGTTAASVGITLPDDMKVTITDSSNADAYPICGFTWILAYVNQKDAAKGLALANMLWWNIHNGQQYAAPLSYGALSPAVVTKAEAEILSMKYNGQPILSLPK